MDILRFITAGSVDDGKSTLIGRLLYDSKSILADQLESIERASRFNHDGLPDLALFTDGLRAEREQGITIDVAYKYFSTPRRKFIIADAPGHIQYTRNMVTGASNAALIIILIDARNGVVEQTRRHSIIASLLNIPNVVVAINKLDLTGYDQKVFDHIKDDYDTVAQRLDLKNVTYIPISALKGDNIVERSAQMNWYTGPTLLEHLETIPLKDTLNLEHARFPVQYVIRPQTAAYPDYRGYAGKITAGIYKEGDEIIVLPSGRTSRIKTVEHNGKPVSEAFVPQSVVLHLEDDIDVSRGDLIVKREDQPLNEDRFDVLLCWMDEKPLVPGGRYTLQCNSATVRGIVKEIRYKLDVNTLEQSTADTVGLNEIAYVHIKAAAPFPHDTHEKRTSVGELIFIDETSYATVGAGLIS